MEEQNDNNGLYMDYVKVDTLFTDSAAKQHTVPMILMLDSSVVSVSVTDIFGKKAGVLVYKSEGDDLDFDVSVDKLPETFNAIYDVLHNLWGDDDDDEKGSNVD